MGKPRNDTKQSQPATMQMETAATLSGLAAIFLWALLASLTAMVGHVPPFELAALTFLVGALAGTLVLLARGLNIVNIWRDVASLPAAAVALGVYGFLVFHASYFFALQHASLIKASLIVYLWPLLIVLMSALLPTRLGGRTLTAWHVAGAALGFAGLAVNLLWRPGGAETQMTDDALGIAAALVAALAWSSYSVATRAFSNVPSLVVLPACALTAVGAWGLHLLLEPTVWPDHWASWTAVAGLGLGPVGLAFYLWDTAMKRGNLQLLGAASYAAPVLSTLLIAGLGLGEAGTSVWVSAVMIAGGALIAGLADKIGGAC